MRNNRNMPDERISAYRRAAEAMARGEFRHPLPDVVEGADVDEIGRLGFLEAAVLAGELLHLAGVRLGIESLGIALGAGFVSCFHKDLHEIAPDRLPKRLAGPNQQRDEFEDARF